MSWYNQIKWFIQRGKRGWSDCDCWNIDFYINKIMPEMLEHLANRKFGRPMGMIQSEWKDLLLEQAVLYRNMQDAYNCSDFKKMSRHLNKILKFHKKYYFCLWD